MVATTSNGLPSVKPAARIARIVFLAENGEVLQEDRGLLHMALTVEDIAGHPALNECIRRQSIALIGAYDASPRISSIFATQQRWLMGHAGLSLYFRSKGKGFTTAEFLGSIALHKVASRNTADAFVKEMLKYQFARYVPGGKDRRRRPMEPTEATLQSLHGWIVVHLATLDGLDQGRRVATYLAKADMVARLQPLIADQLLSSAPVRQPERTFSLFTWLNNGGNIMDRLIAGIENAAIGVERVPTGVDSITEMAAWLRLSRTHLARKLREAEAMGSIGWQGRRGHSVMWVSNGFRREYMMAQAVKLAIIDQALEVAFSEQAP
jgi:hypothetical protein